MSTVNTLQSGPYLPCTSPQPAPSLLFVLDIPVECEQGYRSLCHIPSA